MTLYLKNGLPESQCNPGDLQSINKMEDIVVFPAWKDFDYNGSNQAFKDTVVNRTL